MGLQDSCGGYARHAGFLQKPFELTQQMQPHQLHSTSGPLSHHNLLSAVEKQSTLKPDLQGHLKFIAMCNLINLTLVFWQEGSGLIQDILERSWNVGTNRNVQRKNIPGPVRNILKPNWKISSKKSRTKPEHLELNRNVSNQNIMLGI